MISVLVTGKDSQLALCLKDLVDDYPSIQFTFKNSSELDITSKESISKNFESKTFDYCINCAAYTAVDKAEFEQEKARLVNTTGVKNLALACKKHNVTLIHISTDFVFDGKKTEPYLESDTTNPINIYGKTKRDGELEIINTLSNYFIVRTSWLYSQYGNNFVKTVIRLSNKNDEIKIVNDEIGSPTYARDLAVFVINILNSKKASYGIYNFSNKGKASWFNFAENLVAFIGVKTNVIPISTQDFPTAAIRPRFSMLDTSKTEKTFNVQIDSWKNALERYFKSKH